MIRRLMLSIAFCCAVQVAFTSAATRTVHAQVIGGNRYGIVTIHNKTESTINYSYRIGDGDWRQTSVEPGHLRYYYHAYKYANENRSPSFHVRFDSDMGPGTAWMVFHLERNPAAWVHSDFGRHYDFMVKSGNRINVYER